MKLRGIPLRFWIWSFIHMRPGHVPYGIIHTQTDAWCAACGKRAPK